jgi:hypothetical protein
MMGSMRNQSTARSSAAIACLASLSRTENGKGLIVEQASSCCNRKR